MLEPRSHGDARALVKVIMASGEGRLQEIRVGAEEGGVLTESGKSYRPETRWSSSLGGTQIIV